MYVSLYSPASAAAYASCRVTLPLAKREGLCLCRAAGAEPYRCLPWLPQGRWRCAERVSANTSRMSGVFSLRTAIARLAPCASSTRKPLPCAPLSLGSRRALRLHANAIVFLVINRISELRRGHPAAAAIASLASENAVSISKIRCICCEFCSTAPFVSHIKQTRTSGT